MLARCARGPVDAPPMGASFRIALTAQNDADTKAKYAGLDFDSHDLQDLKVTDFEVVEMDAPIRLTDECVRNKS